MKVPAFVGKIIGSDQVLGTGFIVRDDGLVATCYHVLKAAGKPITESQYRFQLLENATEYALSVDCFDADHDLALLRLDNFRERIDIPLLLTSEKVRSGTAFSVVGYAHHESNDAHRYGYSSAYGDCIGLAERDGHKLIKLSSQDLISGMFGSPVIVEYEGSERIVGVLSGHYSGSATDLLPQGIGLAIQSERLQELMQQSKIRFGRPKTVFLSYSHKDEAFVQRLRTDLQHHGVESVWMDRHNLRPGVKWEPEIKLAIERCSHVIVCVSAASLASPYVKYEYETAAASDKVIIPLLLDDQNYTTLPTELGSRQVLSFKDLGYEKAILELMRARVLPQQLFMLPEMLPVSAGAFTMGSGRDKQQVTLTDFWIAKHGVTVAEYVCFIKWTNFNSDVFWLPETYDMWLKGPFRTFWPNRDLEDYALRYPRQPMHGVSWYEAMAYCRWLSHISGHEFTLPTEAEWEKSARGTDERKFATGEVLNAEVADIRAENGEERHTPKDVCIPGSESFYGCLDMVGHVWNWTLSIESEPYPTDGSAERITPEYLGEPRIIRSGSWRRNSAKATTYHREGQKPIPVDYAGEIGFRLVTHSDPSYLMR